MRLTYLAFRHESRTGRGDDLVDLGRVLDLDVVFRDLRGVVVGLAAGVVRGFGDAAGEANTSLGLRLQEGLACNKVKRLSWKGSKSHAGVMEGGKEGGRGGFHGAFAWGEFHVVTA